MMTFALLLSLCFPAARAAEAVEAAEAPEGGAPGLADTDPGAPAPKRFFFATSAFMIVNALPIADPPGFAQLDFGIRLTPEDVLVFQAITWKYHAPLGIPYGPDYGDPDTFFPGYARDYGVGVAYHRYLWKGLYVGAHATPFVQQYFDEGGDRIQTGFQLFVTGRIGYHIDLWDKRLFVEPSMACTAWPINTNLPPAFQALEDAYPKYFLLEPGLHVGVSF